MHEHTDPGNDIDRSGRDWRGSQGTGVSPTLIGFIVLAIAAIIFIVQNSERPKITFLFFDVRTRLWVAIAVAILLGAVLDRLLAMWWRRRKERV